MYGKNYSDDEPLSTWSYLGYQILFAIPILGIVMLLIYAFSKEENINVRNLARSYHCLIAICAFLYILSNII